jgi:hypothetical protein
MNPPDSSYDPDATLTAISADAEINRLAAPNYSDQWTVVVARLKTVRLLGAILFFTAIFLSFRLAIIGGQSGSWGAVASLVELFVTLGIACLVFFIIEQVAPRTFAKLLQAFAVAWSATWRLTGIPALLRGVGRLLGTVIPTGIKNRSSGLGDRILDLILPDATTNLDAAIVNQLPRDRFPELYLSVPSDLRVTPLLDGRLPDGSMPGILARRVMSRPLAVAGFKKAFPPIIAIIVLMVVINVLDFFPASINAARMGLYHHHENNIAAQNADISQENQKAEADYQAKIAGQQETNTKAMMGYQAQQSDNAAKENAYRQAAAAWMQQRAGYIDHVQNHDAQYIGAYQNWLRAGKTGPQPVMVTSLPPPPVHPVLTAPTAPGMVQGNVAQPVLKNPVADDATPPTPIAALTFGALFALDVLGVAVCLLLFAFVPRINVRRAEEIVAGKYFIQTKAALVRWPSMIAARTNFQRAYRKAVTLNAGYLKGQPTYSLGKATGTLAALGAYSAPEAGADVSIDSESIFTNLLILGGIGTGKTTAFLKPLSKLILNSSTRWGLLMVDPKGVFWQQLVKIAKMAGREEDVIIIGTAPGMQQLNPLLNLDAAGWGAEARSLMDQTSKGQAGGDGAYFKNIAARVLSHASTVAAAIGRKNITVCYQIATVPAVLMDVVVTAMTLPDERKAMFPELDAAVAFLGSFWVSMAKETKDSCMGEIISLLDAAVSDPLLKGFNGTGFEIADGKIVGPIIAEDDDTEQALTDLAFSGKIVITAMSAAAAGIGGRIILMCLKSGFYRAASLREEALGSAHCQAHPVLVLCDEAQDVVSSADSDFWNRARSTGCSGAYATQGYSALNLALGEAATANLTQQFRSKVFLTCEDKATMDEIVRLGGEYMRNQVYEAGQYENIPAWEAQNGQAYIGDAGDEQARAVRYLSRATSKDVLSVESHIDRGMTARQLYTARRYKGGQNSNVTDAEARNYQEMIRAEDLHRSFLSQGNEMTPALTGASIVDFGRFHAFAHIQRAGMARADVIEIQHDYT